MPASLIDVVTLAAVAALLWAPSAVALGVLVTAVFVVPAPLLVPHTHWTYVTVLHVLVLAALARLVLRRVGGSLPAAALRPTPAHVAWLGYVVVVFAVGVVFVVTPGPLGSAGTRLADLACQVGFFVVVLALARELDLRLVATIVAGATVVAGLVAVVEHATGGSLGHWLFADVPGSGVLDAAHPLDVRDGQPRVRAGAEFALQFGWLVVTTLPLLVVAALFSRRGSRRGGRWAGRWAAVAAPVALALAVAAVYWSYTRTALAGVAATLVVFAVAVRRRRVTRFVAGTLVVIAAALAVHPQFLTHLSRNVDTGSISARFERVAPILQQVSPHPFRGLGLGDLAASGFHTTDNAFLLQYAELGAVGVAVLAVLLLVALGQAARALRARDDDLRMIGAACFAGVVAYVASAMAYDAFSLLQGALLLWLLVAVATATAERAGVAIPLPHPTPAAFAPAAALGVGAGFAVMALAPVHVAVDGFFTALSTGQQSGPVEPTLAGAVVAGTVCDAARTTPSRLPEVGLQCRLDPQAAGIGHLRIEGPSRSLVTAAARDFATFVHDHIGLDQAAFLPEDAPTSGRASMWATAPAWVPIAVLGGLFLVPWRGSPVGRVAWPAWSPPTRRRRERRRREGGHRERGPRGRHRH